MKSRNYSLFLDDIRHSCEKIIVYTSEMSKDVFLADEKTYDAVLRHLTIIGEAVKQIPPEIRDLHPAVEWTQIGRFRDVVVHHYFGLKEEVIWEIVEAKVPALLTALTQQSEQA
jgi:uncharacterized protein with HEPN domain